MISNFKLLKLHLNYLPLPSTPLLENPQIKPSLNPNKTLIKFLKSTPNSPHKSSLTMSSSSPSSSWSCSSCTFLNPPSQKLTCQICQTPSAIPPPLSASLSSSSDKWACKACTFLNSYSRSNCEICNTRVPSVNHDDFVDPLTSNSDVGSVFFPLRKCSSGLSDRVSDLGKKNIDSGFRDKVRIQVDVDDFGGSSDNLVSHKRKFQETDSENANASYGVAAIDKEDSGVAVMDPIIVDDSECDIVVKRKRDPSDSVQKPIAFSGYRDVKSSKKQTSIFDAPEKIRTVGEAKGSVSAAIAENGEVKNTAGTIKILSYNIWFRDEIEGHLRMQAIGNLIRLHSPDVICFQEVNSVLYAIFQRSSWWNKYHCSVSFERAQNEAYFCMQLAKIPVKSFNRKRFSNTMMDRELCTAHVELNKNNSLVIATTHLESPCPAPPKWDQMYTKERVHQAKEAITVLQQYPNVIFCGDMNWDEKKDGPFPYTDGWFDAWEKLRPSEIGYTYDTKSNAMLTGYRALQKRLDRFICHLTDYKVSRIDMIGTEAILGLEYKREKKVKGKIQELTLPVYPSDHYGLLLTVTPA